MTRKRTATVLALATLVAFGATSCAPGSGAGTYGGGTGNSIQAEGGPGGTGSGPLDGDGFVIPGHVLPLKVGESVMYYSYLELSKDDAQRVTVTSFNYIDKTDLPEGPHMRRLNNGVLVLSVTWQNVKGNVQTNHSYVVATLNSGQVGRPISFLPGTLKNARVDPGKTRSGILTIDIPRGTTTLTIVDYRDNPVARMVIDTHTY